MEKAYGLVKKISNLKPIPPIANRIMELAGDPDSALSDLMELISYDTAVTANLLKICNSAYLGLAVPVDSVQQAVSLLGSKQIIELVLLNTVSENLLDAQQGYQLDTGELWKRSVASALVSKSIARRHNVDDIFFTYTAALLKDIGKVVMDTLVEKSLGKIRFLVTQKGCSFDEAEKEVIGIDHASLGGIIAEYWKFSPQLTFIIKNHHMTNESARTDVETSVVYLSDIVAMMVGAGIGADGLAYKFYEDIFSELHVTATELQGFLLEYNAAYRKAESLLSAI